jgi:dipeptidyl aminopeptidase/acylaminoacyl peptidase
LTRRDRACSIVVMPLPLRSLIGLGLFGLGLFGGCAPPTAATPYPSESPAEGEPIVAADEARDDVVHFLDREIALEPFLAGFPYGDFDAVVEHDRLFYLERGDRYTLRMLELPERGKGPIDPSAGKAVSEIDWSKRNLFGLHYHAPTDSLWINGDERNDEKLNLFVLTLADGKIEKVTDTDYIYAYGFSEDEKSVAFLPRKGTKAPFSSCLHVMDVGSRKAREVVCDDEKLRFTWGRPVFSPDGDAVYFNAQVEGDRNRVQLVEVDLRAAKPKVRPVTDPRKRRTSPGVLKGWVDGDTLLFTANDDGYRNLYGYSRTTKKVRQLTRFTEDVSSARLTGVGVFLAHGTPAGTTLELVDPHDGKRLARGGVTGSVSILDAHGDRALWTHTAPDVVFQLNQTFFEGGNMSSERLVELPAELAERVVACRAKAVKIPTFDEDPATGKTRELHAFLLEPRRPLPEPLRLGLIRSFYGGDNRYERYDHLLCAAGLTVLSPAVRGSSGFGKEFAALNDADLGGDEIVDLFYAARWLEAEVGLEPARIGVYGRSHGGYATMRAMTFPPQTNDRGESYAFGFGLAEAGFSDIEAFYHHTNIPDWVVLEAGDPEVPANLARIRDRSPINHVERLQAPVFLLHGENDWRVPVEGSRNFAKKAQTLGKAVRYVEVKGQGHRVEGRERIVETWQARFDFLSSLPVLAEARANE